MMEQSKTFKVIIVGGSVAGLTTALMLERNGIDYVLLEAYREISPQAGASIAVLPNGNRIMDQLGIYDELMEKAQYCVEDFTLGDTEGNSFLEIHGLGQALIQRHGYPMFFFDRRMLIEVLYKHVKDKSKVLVSKRVVRVEEREEHVTVTTADGSLYQGDIVIGADGFHSMVRREIYRINAGNVPDAEPEPLPADYGCLFGISRGDIGIPKSWLSYSTNKGATHLVASGPDDRTYWCLFYHLGKTWHGKEAQVPKEEDVLSKYGNDAITKTVKFSDLYEKKIASVGTPLHEGTVKQWHSKRCMLIGDSCHKFNPIGGQGGNSAMETAAAVTNGLVTLLKSSAPTSESLRSLFHNVQALRSPRAASLIERAARLQRVCATKHPVAGWAVRHVLPLLGAPVMVQLLSVGYPDAVSLDMLPVPARPRSVPYVDELRHRPRDRGNAFSRLVVAVLMALSVAGAYFLLWMGAVNGTWALVREAVAASEIRNVGLQLQGLVGDAALPGVERLCKSLVAAFITVVSGVEDYTSKVQSAYFLVAFYFPILSIMCIEGYRAGNKLSLLWSPSFWTGAAQLFGLGVVLPLYFLAKFFHARKLTYWMPASRHVPVAASRAMLPALLLGYLFPTGLILGLSARSEFLQKAIVFWQISPILVIALVEIFSQRSGSVQDVVSDAKEQKRPQPLDPLHDKSDTLHLGRIYTVAVILSTIVHQATMLVLVMDPEATFWQTFVPSLSHSDPVKSVAAGMKIFFQFDFLLSVTASFLWSVTMLWDMDRVGVTRGGVGERIAAVVFGYVLMGPGAVTVALYKWKERCMTKANTSSKKASRSA